MINTGVNFSVYSHAPASGSEARQRTNHTNPLENAANTRQQQDTVKSGEQPANRVDAQQSERAANYVAALRELKSSDLSPKQAQASKTFLDIAHFEQSSNLIDTYA